MNRVAAFTVLGDPAPQGSKTSVRTRSGRHVMREDNPATKPWRQAAAAAAIAAIGDREPATGPLRLTATFVFRRPAGHYGTGRNRDRLKPSAPLHVRTRPDLDKLARAIGDAITGIVCRDDAQIVALRIEKHYGTTALAYVLVEELEPDEDRAGAIPSEDE